MTTKITKLSVLAFLGLGLTVYGQSGKVGINTDKPAATLEIQPSTVNLAGTTNEGILAPKLSKTRVASIETPVEGTLVYVIDDATKTNGAISNYTGNDTKVAKITEKGYYYYNGVEWIKSKNNVEGLWKYTQNTQESSVNGSTSKDEYALIPSSTNNNKYRIIASVGENINNKTQLKSYEGRLTVFNYLEDGTESSSTTLRTGGLEIYRGVSEVSQTTLGYIDFKNNIDIDYNTRLRAVDFLADTDTSNDDKNKALRLESMDTANGNTFTFEVNGRETTFSNPNYIYSFGKKGATLKSLKSVESNSIGNYIYHRMYVKTGKEDTGNSSFIDWSMNRFKETIDPTQDWKGTVNRLQKSIDERKMGFIDFGISNNSYNDILDNNGLGFGYNETVHAVIRENGNVGIGITTPSEKLEVIGNIKANTFIASNGNTFPDYVFQKYYTGASSIKADYSFKTLSQVEDFVKANGHLPGYQSAEAIKKQGYIDLMATQLTNVEKIEELYLHSIEQDKALKAKDAKIAELEARLQKLEALLVTRCAL
ncbi:hypothetical protein PG294_10815 [Riemerella anatipestifer]|uniref:hypothetical protein n=1 Tax=Riemerella anatipestifer TaxID=34085 RepID=UPI0007ECE41F|nr:hypothetical protein [Riemerella anatipestifer]AZZ59428.1 hypothetical protein AWB57_10590 [Riemerella anatipestifer]MCQ4156080.1 hypothetical protein [Riemerella anatipestifer]MDD1540245.1 hypothetical protein [Riemerella anatipestifer]MDY3347832.1 hypothetical protein [Riemerella anatipestifer]MDY3350158.1 hypothetical protein [Riemerella anatipestifer]